ncbi:CCR4-Not complex component [Caulochytrium protostelioides]|nr:CCR4-Not complex component [Caulochytrium protostelioides]
MNALVLTVGMYAIEEAERRARASSSRPPPADAPALVFATPSKATTLFHGLCTHFDTEGRYFFLSAMANQLRYPNSHTHFFSFMLLQLFAKAESDVVPEQITRVLIERLIVHRPHPYGLLITFIELLRNPAYARWDHRALVKLSPDIARLFNSVEKSITASMNRTVANGLPTALDPASNAGAGLAETAA